MEKHFLYNGKKPQTRAIYEHRLKTYILPRIGDLPLQDCSVSILENLLIEVHQKGSRAGKELSRATVEQISIVLGVGFKEAYRQRLIGFNPMAEVRVPKGSRKKVTHLTDIELSSLRKAWLESQFADFIELASVTGARRGEILALRWDDFNEEKRSLSITKTRIRLNGHSMENSPKSPNSVRDIELTASQCQRLKAHKAQQSQHRLKAGKVWNGGEDYIFTDKTGQPLEDFHIAYAWRKICRKAGTGQKHFHALRHTHITALLQAGVQPYVVAQRAGDKVTTVLTSYAHAIREDDSRCAEIFEAKMARL
jgi:integrase